MHVHKKYKTRVGDRQRKSGFCGILAQKVSVRKYARINYAPLSNLTMLMYTNKFQLDTAYTVKCTWRFLNLLSAIIMKFEIGLLTELSRLLSVSTWNRTINKRNNHSQMKSFRSLWFLRSVRIPTSVILDSSQTYISANEKQVRP